MNYYYDLQRIDIADAINKMAEVILPRFMSDKILSVNILFEIGDYRRKNSLVLMRSKDCTFIYNRQENNMFAGYMDGGHLNISKTSAIESLACDEKNWRDEVGKKISDIASFLSKPYEDTDGLTVYISFGAFGVQIIHGNIKTKLTGKKANFIPVNI